MEDRRQYDREILSEIKEVKGMVQEIQVDRAVLKDNVLRLEKADSHTRLCKLEGAHTFWKAAVIAVPSFGGLLFGALRYFKMV